MAANLLYQSLAQEFKRHPVVTRENLLKFFRRYQPELNDATFSWRIFDLKRRNIISELKNGVYTLDNRLVFLPSLNESMRTIIKLMRGQYDPNFYDIWDTICLNDLTKLQAASSLIVLEVEKGQMESVFFSLRDKGFKEVFVKPDEIIVERYVSEAQHPVIIKPFISRSPVQEVEGVMIPTLEKILVDLYCDEKVYFAFQGSQLALIYRQAASRYALNFSRLLNYAKRRNREDEIKNMLLKVLDQDLIELLNC